MYCCMYCCRLLSEGPKLSSVEPLKQPAPSQPTAGVTESTVYALPHNSHPSQATLPSHIPQWPHATPQSQGTQLPPPYTANNAPPVLSGAVYPQTDPALSSSTVGYGGGMVMGGTQPHANKQQRLVYLELYLLYVYTLLVAYSIVMCNTNVYEF